MVIPFAPSARQRYARLIPPDGREVNEALLSALVKLTATMAVQLQSNENSLIPAGYTYFGQFIDHDLTLDLTPLDKAGQKPPYLTTNRRVPWLDMDHLYGEGPDSTDDWHLYDDDRVSFRVGNRCLPGGRSFDVPVDENGRALVSESRNNENLIVRQVHALFLHLHNRAVQELPPTLPARVRFAAARDRVRWQYQWLVVHDYLPRVCRREVYERVVEKGERLIDFQTRGFSIPVEFSQAAFRFGHSMVRDQYVLNTDPPEPGTPAHAQPVSGVVDLADLFSVTHRPGQLLPRCRINWTRFLVRGTLQQGREPAMLIDTHIAGGLFRLPPEAIGLFVKSLSPEETNALPLRTLLRGTLGRLATGEAVAAAFGRSALRSDFPSPEAWKHLDEVGLKDHTPLWYYVLLEAQLETGGRTLGTLGSSLVASVIEGALRDDPDSFVNRPEAGPAPLPWRGPDGEAITVKTLLDVARVVGLA